MWGSLFNNWIRYNILSLYADHERMMVFTAPEKFGWHLKIFVREMYKFEILYTRNFLIYGILCVRYLMQHGNAAPSIAECLLKKFNKKVSNSLGR